MKIIRFIDEHGVLHYGEPANGDQARVLDGLPGSGFTTTDRVLPVHKLLTPIDPVAILCIGLNYGKHAEETGAALPQHPCVFMKNPAAANHPGDPIVLPACCMDPPEVDYEVELAVIIGRDMRNADPADALTYVAGYTVGNDVSARLWQKDRSGGQWVRGKSFDTFCPLGPAMVSADDIPDPQQLELTCKLNGETMQSGSTSDMVFPVNDLLARLSCGTTLLAGTVVLTGTPPGVGVARTPPVVLQPGDRLDLTIDAIGTLGSPVVADE